MLSQKIWRELPSGVERTAQMSPQISALVLEALVVGMWHLTTRPESGKKALADKEAGWLGMRRSDPSVQTRIGAETVVLGHTKELSEQMKP